MAIDVVIREDAPQGFRTRLVKHEWFRIEDWNEDEEDWDEPWATFDHRDEAIAAYEAHVAELQSI